MRKMLAVLLVLWAVPAWAGTSNCSNPAACTVTCNGTNDHTALSDAISGATAGSTITIQAGTCSFSGTVAFSKYVKIAGAGGGGVVGRSATWIALGTGSKSFPWETAQANLTPSVGETLTARYASNALDYMVGTVTSFDGTTLVLNVSSYAGTGSRKAFIFERAGTTTVANNYTTSGTQALLSITESTAGSTEVSGIHITTGSATSGWHIHVEPVTGGKPVLIHDNWLSMTWLGGIETHVNRGVIYRNSFTAKLCADNTLSCGGVGIEGAVYAMPEEETTDGKGSWSSVSLMGTADTDGTHSLFVEDNYFVGFQQAGVGPESGGRIVVRNNVFDSSNLGWHGLDSETLGARSWEIYDNVFLYSDIDSFTDPPNEGHPYNINSWINGRGGTGLITGNTFALLSSWWTQAAEIHMAAYALHTVYVGKYWSCWGAGISGVQYPYPRQMGMGYVTGAAGNDVLGYYKGDSEPIYIWSNSGSSRIDFDGLSGACGAGEDATTDYIVLNRDYYLSAKPGWTRYPYPHPLRSGSAVPTAPTNVRIR